jgi:hypothetical protein
LIGAPCAGFGNFLQEALFFLWSHCTFWTRKRPRRIPRLLAYSCNQKS